LAEPEDDGGESDFLSDFSDFFSVFDESDDELESDFLSDLDELDEELESDFLSDFDESGDEGEAGLFSGCEESAFEVDVLEEDPVFL
jgi:hypothetical protein